MDDLRENLNEFYQFLKDYDYIEATSRIKSTMYDQAVQLMKSGQNKQVSDSDAAEPLVE